MVVARADPAPDPVATLARRVIAWQRQHGRHGLPWQGSRDAYRIWLSEIMLQQTQVATVVGYYQRFLARFPDLTALAQAAQAEVMPYWAGLGYYARARNLHRCAGVLVERWGGRFPEAVADLQTLPGIGRSTAAAIAAFASDVRAAILDGNVKRVLARHFGVTGDPSRREVDARLWALAQAQLPGRGARDARMPAYTQGLMDLGATVCTRGQPACGRCPLTRTCVARRDQRQHELPTPKAKKTLPVKTTAMLVLEQGGCVLLHRRPETGVWGGLLSLPEFDTGEEPAHAARALGVVPGAGTATAAALPLAAFTHTFTHYRLHVQPYWLQLPVTTLAEPGVGDRHHVWTPLEQLPEAALPAPVRKLLDGLYPIVPQRVATQSPQIR